MMKRISIVALDRSGWTANNSFYTYNYLPLTPGMKDSVFEPVVLSVADGEDCRDLDIKVYMSQYPWDKGGKTIGIKSL